MPYKFKRIRAKIKRSLLSLGCFLTSLSGIALAQTWQYSNSELIVKLRSDALSKQSPSAIDALNSKYGATRVENISPVSSRSTSPLQQVSRIWFSNPINIEEALLEYGQNPEVEYVQPNFVHRIHLVPNDSLLENQGALDIINASEAWDLQTGSPDVVVGVIDTGIDFDHEDLEGAIWLNNGEDLNGNGRFDAEDLNGIDDDGNGFIDDIHGWDFTHAPTFPDGGDYLDPDNDPGDENGHGTQVAGIIGASGNNRKGIAGIAFGCRIMNLRAGTSLGFLEEDDVAAAVVYAVDNGAHVINMSFGDVVASPLLRDIIRYAHDHGCVIVASSGNSNTDEIHFPSGFAETISVGATDMDDELASFSNFGSSVDVVAPGVDILTTGLANSYTTFGGTSAAAPVVAGVAALLLSKTPELAGETLRGILTSTAVDLGAAGWDNLYASGRVDALAALQTPWFSLAKLEVPDVSQGYASGIIEIRGTASGATFNGYRLELGAGETPDVWEPLTEKNGAQVIDQVLFSLSIDGLADTSHTLRLVVENRDGSSVEDKVLFFIDRTPPQFSNIILTEMTEGANPGLLIEFETDDLCDAAIQYRAPGSKTPFQEQQLAYRTKTHRIFLQQGELDNLFEFQIRATNVAGLFSVDDNDGQFFTGDLRRLPVGGIPVEEVRDLLPAAFLLPKISDFDDDGLQEVILNPYDEKSNFTALAIFEYGETGFEESFVASRNLIPRDWGDSDGDGLLEILAGIGDSTFVLEADSASGFPSREVWQADGLWASRFADLDRDGKGELILREGISYAIFEADGSGGYQQVAVMTNPTTGSNSVGVPHTEIGDFDNDGLLEILAGDSDGDIYLYESTGDNSVIGSWSAKLPLVDATDYIAAGDFDGDGIPEFAAGSHSESNLNTESTFDSRHWIYQIYKTTGDNRYEVVWQHAFFGFQSPADFDAGVSAADIDNDTRDELLISVFPDFYIVDFDDGTYKIIWHAAPNRSNAVVTADFDDDGMNEFYFNTGNEVRGYRFQSDFAGPATPVGLVGRPLGPSRIELSWQPESSGNGFAVYRGTTIGSMTDIATTMAPPFVDDSLSQNVDYFYRITTIDSTRPVPESLPTPAIRLRPAQQPTLEQATALSPWQIRLTFSSAMGPSITNQTNYEIIDVGAPTSAIVGKSGRECIVTSPTGLAPGEYLIVAQNLRDTYGTPIDSAGASATFQVLRSASSPYLVSAELLNPRMVRLTFNQRLDTVTASIISNYEITPGIRINGVTIDSNSDGVVILAVEETTPISNPGVDYLVRVKNVTNPDGDTIQFGIGDALVLFFENTDLSQVTAFPNPYRADFGTGFVTISGLTEQATVRILDSNGRLISTLQEKNGTGLVQWSMQRRSGKQVPSGIYIYLIESLDGERVKGKFAIIR